MKNNYKSKIVFSDSDVKKKKFEVLCFIIPAVGADLYLTPPTLAVLRRDVAEFTCRTSNMEWTVMILSLNDKSILTIYNQTGVLPSPTNNHVTARPLSPGSPRKGWIFSLNTTTMEDETKVTCVLQGIKEESASLFVQGWCARCPGCGQERKERSFTALTCTTSSNKVCFSH